MRIIVMNNSGNVGKSTICQHMLYDRIPNSKIVRVETLNTDGEATGEKLGADDIEKIFSIILSDSNVIVDVGASNIENFKDKLENDFAGSHTFIDYFIVPVTPEEKQQIDTIQTILDLDLMGVPTEKIKIVFNRSNPKRKIEEQYSHIFNDSGLKSIGFEVNEKTSRIQESSLFKTLDRAGFKYSEIKEMTDDLSAQIKEAKGKEKMELELLKFYRLGYDSYQAGMQKAFNDLKLDLETLNVENEQEGENE